MPRPGTGEETRRVRLDLGEDEARALHAGLQEALAANLLAPDHAGAARHVLDRLTSKVPSWLDRAPVRGEAGYLIAAEAVLRALVDAEDHGRRTLTDLELAHALAEAKPAGVSITDVLTRMRQEHLLRSVALGRGESPWWSAAPAGRQLLAGRGDAGAGDEWRVTDPEGLAELIFREHRPYREAFRPAVQAIGHISDADFEALADELRAAGLLEPPSDGPSRLTLTNRGATFAEERVRATLPRHTLLWELPPPPIPYRQGLPIRAGDDDRRCRCGTAHATWLKPSSKTKLHQTLRRNGAAEWECRWCGRRWTATLRTTARRYEARSLTLASTNRANICSQ